ncbi:MAG TPA: NAD(P)/FAD-dependent oxidoreductase [Candidatus Binataceae bacterium]|nr:NAD(P)/FAD-dependent oxidoreductase [Candidatus Binataceae bacterium]
MPGSRKCDVLIAGAGPAGLATALYLLRSRTDLRGRLIALEKSAHPRFKTCAGGLIPKTILALEELGIALQVPSVTVTASMARTVVGDALVRRDEPVGTVIRRDEFDAMLACEARAAGLEIVENCRIVEVEQNRDGVRVATERGTFEAPILVGADGSGSVVRKLVFGRGKEAVGRALMTDLPIDPARTIEFSERCYRFDFRCVSGGIRGYAWSFPCIVDGEPHLNVGIYDQRPRESGEKGGEQFAMVRELERSFPDLPLSGLRDRTLRFRAFPIRWFDQRDRYVNGRVMLAGDAAGVDPLMGEGISCAFEHGKLAADAIGRYLEGAPNALTAYDRALHSGAIGWKLRKLAFAARHFYGPYHRAFFRLSRASRRAQEIGLDWYNGARHLDEAWTATLVARWAGSVLFGTSVR